MASVLISHSRAVYNTEMVLCKNHSLKDMNRHLKKTAKGGDKY